MSKLTVAGIGPGEADYILPAVIEKMKKAHTVIAAKRVLFYVFFRNGEN